MQTAKSVLLHALPPEFSFSFVFEHRTNQKRTHLTTIMKDDEKKKRKMMGFGFGAEPRCTSRGEMVGFT